MTRLRHIIQFTPAVFVGLLAALWIASQWKKFGWGGRVGGVHFGFGIGNGTIGGGFTDPTTNQHEGWVVYGNTWSELRYAAGHLNVWSELPDGSGWSYGCDAPILLLITLLLPMAIGPFVRFRFRLWHYLAFTAFVALELAYYLHWQ